MEKYCKNDRCSERYKGRCKSADVCGFFNWDIDRENKPSSRSKLNDTHKVDKLTDDKTIAQNKPNKAVKEYVPREEDEQTELYLWCLFKNIPFVHIPNERKCSVVQGARLKRQGVQSGFPDNFIPIPNNGYNGLFIELKRRKKSLTKVSETQEKWLKLLNTAGYKAVVCYGTDEAESEIKEYLKEQE